MSTLSFKAKFARVATFAAAASMAATAIVAVGGGTPAGADPNQTLVGVGSDTIQDVTNAFAGFTTGTQYTPVLGSSTVLGVTTYTQLASYNAFDPAKPAFGSNPQCITPKVSAPTFYRPNGSGQGQGALSRSIDGTTYTRTSGNAGSCSSPTASIAGLIDFGRSSGGPKTPGGTDLDFVPFARDGVSFAAYRASGGAPVTTISKADLVDLFTNGPKVIGGVNIIPCGIQTGSGTFDFWNTALGIAATENAATATCQALTGSGLGARVEENNANTLKLKGDQATAGSEVIVGFSGASYIAQFNGKAPSTLPSPKGTVLLGAISAWDGTVGHDLGAPYGTGNPAVDSTLVANPTFYDNAVFGRPVYYVLPHSKVSGAGNTGMKQIFLSSPNTKGVYSSIAAVPASGQVAAICSNTVQATAELFGFLSFDDTPSSCGQITTTGGLSAS